MCVQKVDRSDGHALPSEDMLCRVKTCSKVSRQRVKKLMGIFKLYSLASLGYYAIENKVAWAISERFCHCREYYSTDLDTIMNVISI